MPSQVMKQMLWLSSLLLLPICTFLQIMRSKLLSLVNYVSERDLYPPLVLLTPARGPARRPFGGACPQHVVWRRVLHWAAASACHHRPRGSSGICVPDAFCPLSEECSDYHWNQGTIQRSNNEIKHPFLEASIFNFLSRGRVNVLRL